MWCGVKSVTTTELCVLFVAHYVVEVVVEEAVAADDDEFSESRRVYANELGFGHRGIRLAF